jgi:hypothetical protein
VMKMTIILNQIGVNLTSYGAVVLTSHESRFHVSCRVSDSAERDW